VTDVQSSLSTCYMSTHFCAWACTPVIRHLSVLNLPGGQRCRCRHSRGLVNGLP